MPIERSARDATRPAHPQACTPCLGCPDCAGLCWSRFELSFVPDKVLHPRTPA